VPEDVRAWLGRVVGPTDDYPARARARRRWWLTVAAVVGIVAVGVLGYSIGVSRLGDAETAQRAGMTAGERSGAAAGSRQGYASAFRPARERAYRTTYRKAYLTAYRGAFENVGLAAPRRVTVPGP